MDQCPQSSPKPTTFPISTTDRKEAPTFPIRQLQRILRTMESILARAGTDAQSTFSIDVDTASYTIARRKLNSGSLPPFSSVRVEDCQLL